MPIETNEISQNAMGGTELMLHRIHSAVDPDVMNEIQLIPSRVRDLKEDKIRVMYCQDTADDPESARAFDKNGWSRFHKIIFASNWQMQTFIARWRIPWSRCLVIPNAIEPIERTRTEDGQIKFIYHTTPHRGLNILVAVFNELTKKYGDKIHLDVYSSFKIYGQGDRDVQFKEVFDQIDASPYMTNHGTVPNSEIRSALANSDVFAYPNTWTETSCISLIEAMSAGVICIHPNLGALFETSGNWTTMYQFNEDVNIHASWAHKVIESQIEIWDSPSLRAQAGNQKAFVDVFHNWNNRKAQWDALFRSLLNEPRTLPKEMFVYRS